MRRLAGAGAGARCATHRVEYAAASFCVLSNAGAPPNLRPVSQPCYLVVRQGSRAGSCRRCPLMRRVSHSS